MPLKQISTLLVPPTCIACKLPLELPQSVLCVRCEEQLPLLTAPCCQRCALPLPCAPCPALTATFSGAWSLMAYEQTARQLILKLKQSGSKVIAEYIASLMAAKLTEEAIYPLALVPVPAAGQRQRSRGFNHAGLLASALGSKLHCPVSNCLAREDNRRQVKLSRSERLLDAGIKISCRGKPHESVTLLDDIYTTGATLNAAATALKAAGATHVTCITFARTLL